MFEQEKIRSLITIRCAPLLDMALSLLVLQNPERFGTVAWAERVGDRLTPASLERLRTLGEQTDLFAVAYDLEQAGAIPAAEALARLAVREPELAGALTEYWEAISAEVGGWAGLLAESAQRELLRLGEMDPLAFICRFSDRVSVAGDGEAIILHWGKGMRVPLADLDRILFVPSAFSPRRLMFYRLGSVQIFFYDPRHEEPLAAEEPQESLILALAALADPTRLKLLRQIAREGLPAQEMARRLGVNESTVSRHLKLLTEAGLVGRDRQEGKFLFYSLNPERVDQVAGGVKAFLGRV